MSKKDKYAEEYEELQREIVRDKVNEVFRNDPVNYRDGMEEIGFTWHDDNYPSEEEEEVAAIPHNDIQKKLVAYFDGHTSLSDDIIDAFQYERHAEIPNYPLIRKYFRAGNQPLKQLILSGLQSDPTNLECLADLAFFHEFNDILPELVEYFIRACLLETNL